ncbi:response regulator [Pleomorphovibrio marinus]|uniref:response regulator n=1 Tax=Pleomorphovibrio marinus TaxID=2164132 RepID=UPI000E0A4156|nr:response regulator [Pleomorphovibrio marinus]
MSAIQILLVEDNEGDVFMIREALENTSARHQLSVAKDGLEAIETLMHRLKTESSNLPDLILLDINLPKRNGHEVLQFIKHSEDLRHLPVVILTTSSSPEDIFAAYHHYANGYITKPSGGKDLSDVADQIEEYWVGLSQFPPKIQS